MPIFDWIGKKDVVNHHKDVPFRFLKKTNSKSVGDSKNLLIEGDNLEALKSLLPNYKGKVKCIYIDPPYNTGNEKWVYNDNVNSPKIKKWLGKVVDADDLSKHDKWLCMLYPRLALLHELLADDGVIFISIDHNEEHHLRLVMNEIFGEKNYRNTFVVSRVKKNIKERETVPALNFGYNLVMFYSKSNSGTIIPPTRIQKKPVRWHGFDAPDIRSNMDYELFGQRPPEGRHWMYSKERAEKMIRAGKLRPKKNSGKPEYELPKSNKTLVDTNWTDIVESSSKYNFPNGEKNVKLVKRVIGMVPDKNAIVLDSFAGSGTTAHAVIQLNQKDNGNRKFILVEMETEIAKNISAKRISGVTKALSDNDATKAGFTYCTLGNELFDKDGQISCNCTFEQLAHYVFFGETRKPLDRKKSHGIFLGESDGVGVYLIFGKPGQNVLDFATVKSLPKDTRKVIYADSCSVSEDKLQQWNVAFKQIPYEVDVF